MKNRIPPSLPDLCPELAGGPPLPPRPDEKGFYRSSPENNGSMHAVDLTDVLLLCAVYQKTQNAGIWNSSKLRYLLTIFSYLIIIFIYLHANFSLIMIEHNKCCWVLKIYFYINQSKWPKMTKLAFSTLALLLTARHIINLKKISENLQTILR